MLKQIYLTLLFLSAFSINSFGQDLSFEKTVEYLNEKIYFFTTNNGFLSATKQGDIDIYFDVSGVNYRFNLFEINLFNTKNKRGIHVLRIQCKEKDCELVRLSRNELTTNIKLRNQLEISVTRGNQVSKMIGAFDHLKTLCNPDSDPF